MIAPLGLFSSSTGLTDLVWGPLQKPLVLRTPASRGPVLSAAFRDLYVIPRLKTPQSRFKATSKRVLGSLLPGTHESACGTISPANNLKAEQLPYIQQRREDPHVSRCEAQGHSLAVNHLLSTTRTQEGIQILELRPKE